MTLDIFAEVINVFAPKLAKIWLNLKDNLEMPDIIAMLLCALYSPSSTKVKIWEKIEKDFINIISQITEEHHLKSNWYRTDESDNVKLLAGLLDIMTTGGIYSDKYKSLNMQKTNEEQK